MLSRMKKLSSLGSLFVLLLSVCGNVMAHDTFIMPEKFRVSKGETVKIGFHSADAFPESTGAPKRLQEPSVHTSKGRTPVTLSEDGKRWAGNVTVDESGYVIVTAINAAATAPMKPNEFLEYVKEEGLDHVVQARIEKGEADKAANERYTMYPKSLVLVGEPNDGYKRVAGLPIEIVPEKDPYSLKRGESLPVRVLFKGAPARGVQVMAASTLEGAAKNKSVGKTDAQGRISIPVTPGQWRLHTIHMERTNDPKAEWESFWATLTFEVR